MSDRTQAARRRFIADLEGKPAEEVHALLRLETCDELCALNGMASRRLRDLIQREIRNTDDL